MTATVLCPIVEATEILGVAVGVKMRRNNEPIFGCHPAYTYSDHTQRNIFKGKMNNLMSTGTKIIHGLSVLVFIVRATYDTPWRDNRTLTII